MIFERMICAVCGRKVTISKDGFIRRHVRAYKLTDDDNKRWEAVWCESSGKEVQVD